MKKSVRRVLYRFLPARLLIGVLLALRGRRAGLRNGWGYARSVRLMRPVDAQDQPLPWLPYCAVELLSERIAGVRSVLEFGAGHSTLYFMTRVPQVTSVEHHAEWLEKLRASVRSNVTLLHASRDSPATYTEPIRAGHDRYDLILVDGQHRVECFKLALQRLTSAGVIVLDDSDRPAYTDVFPLATAAGFRILHLRGHKADSLDLHRTSFFYRDSNCLGI